MCFKFSLNFVINSCINDSCLFRRTNHTIIKSFWNDDIVDRTFNLSISSDIRWYVTSSNTKRWLTSWISCLNHTRSTSRKYRSNLRMVHQKTSCFDRWLFNPLDTILRSTCFNSRITNNTSSFCRWFLSWWVEGEDNRVTCLQCNEGFENRCWSWVSCWCNPTDNTNRLSDRNQTLFFIFSNNAYSFVIFNTIPNVFRSIHVLDGFIFINTTPCFINGQFSQIHVFI